MTSEGGPWGSPTSGPPTPPPPAPRPPPRGGRRLGGWALLFAAVVALVFALHAAFPEAVRTGDDWSGVLYGLGFLLVLCAGGGRASRGDLGQHLRHGSIWVGMAAVLALGYAYRAELAGVPQRLQLAFATGEPVAVGDHELAISQDDEGAFMAVGKVEGQRVRFIIDTGASDTVLSPDDARRLGIDVDRLDYSYVSETANGVGHGAPYVVRSLELGPIREDGFRLVINRAPMHGSLLGLSFLKRLSSFEIRGRQLILKWRDGA